MDRLAKLVPFIIVALIVTFIFSRGLPDPKLQVSLVADISGDSSVIWDGEVADQRIPGNMEQGSVVTTGPHLGTYVFEAAPTDRWHTSGFVRLYGSPLYRTDLSKNIQGYEKIEFYAKTNITGKPIYFSIGNWDGSANTVDIAPYVAGGSLSTEYKLVSIPFNTLANANTKIWSLDFMTIGTSPDGVVPGLKIYLDSVVAKKSSGTTTAPPPSTTPPTTPTQSAEIWTGEAPEQRDPAKFQYGSVVTDAHSGGYAFLSEAPDKWHGGFFHLGGSPNYRKDISTAKTGLDTITFWIKTNMTGKTARFGIRNWNDASRSVDISQYVQGGTIDGTWRYVSIPYSALETATFKFQAPDSLWVSTVDDNYGLTYYVPGIKFWVDDIMAVKYSGTTPPPPPPTPSTVSAPIISPNGGSFTSPTSVSITTATAGASIRYTTDGSTPTASSPLYTTPFTLSNSATVRAMAMASGMTNSSVTSASFTVNIPVPTAATPIFSPNGGTFSSPTTVTITSSTAGASIRYTTDGTTPSSASTLYTGPFSINSTMVIRAIAIATGMNNSGVASASFNVSIPAKFNIGDWVRVINGPVSVRDASGNLLGTQATGEVGQITSGPTVTSTGTRYGVNFQTGSDGTVDETYLEKTSAPTPTTQTTYTANLAGANEVPPVSTSAMGNATVVLTEPANTIKVSMTLMGISNQTAAHIHGPAVVGANAGALFTLPNGNFTDYSISLTATQVADLKSGKWYINVHTSANSGGEIRGQIGVTETPPPPTGTLYRSVTPTVQAGQFIPTMAMARFAVDSGVAPVTDSVPMLDAAASVEVVPNANAKWSEIFGCNFDFLAGKVLRIPSSARVVYDCQSDVEIKGISLSGTLEFDPNMSTKLTVFTIMVNDGAKLYIRPLPQYSVVVNFKGRTNDTEDPFRVLGGITQMGVGSTIEILGRTDNTSYAKIAPVAAGATTLTLLTPVQNWKVGDKLILPPSTILNNNGIWPANYRWGGFASGPNFVVTADIVQIASISGNTITLTTPTRYEHEVAGHTYAANLTRQIVFNSGFGDDPNGAGLNRAHVMNMRGNITIKGTALEGFVRTRNARFNNAVKLSNGTFTTQYGTKNPNNQEGRYGIHMHHSPGLGIFDHNVILNAGNYPARWGLVCHQSLRCEANDNVVAGYFGANFNMDEQGGATSKITNNFALQFGKGVIPPGDVGGGTEGGTGPVHDNTGLVPSRFANWTDTIYTSEAELNAKLTQRFGEQMSCFWNRSNTPKLTGNLCTGIFMGAFQSFGNTFRLPTLIAEAPNLTNVPDYLKSRAGADGSIGLFDVGFANGTFENNTAEGINAGFFASYNNGHNVLKNLVLIEKKLPGQPVQEYSMMFHRTHTRGVAIYNSTIDGGGVIESCIEGNPAPNAHLIDSTLKNCTNGVKDNSNGITSANVNFVGVNTAYNILPGANPVSHDMGKRRISQYNNVSTDGPVLVNVQPFGDFLATNNIYLYNYGGKNYELFPRGMGPTGSVTLPKVIGDAKEITTHTIYSSDLTYTQGWDRDVGPKKDATSAGYGYNNTVPMFIDGVPFAKGLSMTDVSTNPGPAFVTLPLAGQCTNFIATVKARSGTARFKVFVGEDGADLFGTPDYDSGNMTPTTPGKTINIALPPRTFFVTLALQGMPGTEWIVGDWGDAKFTCGGADVNLLKNNSAAVINAKPLSSFIDDLLKLVGL